MQKGIGDIRREPLIQTEARTVFHQGISRGMTQGINETKKKTALKMLKKSKFTIDEISEYSGLSITEVKQLAEFQTEK